VGQEEFRIKRESARPSHLALANSPSAFVLINLQKLSMNAFASALAQPPLQLPITPHKNKAGCSGNLISKQNNKNGLRTDNEVGYNPTQFLCGDRYGQFGARIFEVDL